jgi:hypothetical protein
MKINFAHGQGQFPDGNLRDYVVFEVNASSGTDSDREELLLKLAVRARALGLNIDKSALIYRVDGQVKFYGAPDIVTYLSKQRYPQWTHYLDI